MINLPLIERPDLYHIGTMDASESDPHSYEGHLLSVSEDPDTWRRIARLSGDEWSLTCPNAFFVDVHAVREDSEIWNAFLFWADSKGLVEFVDCHIATWYDDEFGCDMSQDFLSREDLEAEFADRIGEEEGDVTASVRKHTPRLTEKAMQKYGLTRLDSAWDVTYALPDWVRAKFCPHDARIKGLWWEDENDPSILSAPCGGIFPEMVEMFTALNLTRASGNRLG
jgi:hypothetical protein